MADLSILRWRTGRKVGRTIYAQPGADLSDEDVLIGVMDTPALARSVVTEHNAARNARLKVAETLAREQGAAPQLDERPPARGGHRVLGRDEWL